MPHHSGKSETSLILTVKLQGSNTTVSIMIPLTFSVLVKGRQRTQECWARGAKRKTAGKRRQTSTPGDHRPVKGQNTHREKARGERRSRDGTHPVITGKGAEGEIKGADARPEN